MNTARILELTPNRPSARPYRGGSGIARFRGMSHDDPYTPEDFVGSTTEVFAGGGVGLTRLPGGMPLRDAVVADAQSYLGAEHVDALGAQTGLLTKLLSTDERLFVHAHPDDDFAAEHLHAGCGKTESWIILDTDGADPYVLLGFRRDVTLDELARWFETQDVAAMTDAMNRLPVAAGDTVHVPAGVPHGIGPGITLVELQQPTDLSLLLEYQGYSGLDSDSALLGLPVSVAVSAFRRDAVGAAELAGWRSGRGRQGRVERLLPAAADRVYRAWRVQPGTEPVRMPAGFAIAVVIAGAGELAGRKETVAARAGQTFLVPHSAGEVTVATALEVVWCSPPQPPRPLPARSPR